MRKLLFVLCVTLLFSGCSKDDNDTDRIFAQFSSDQFTGSLGNYLTKTFGFTSDAITNDYHPDVKIGDAYFANYECPNEKKIHNRVDAIKRTRYVDEAPLRCDWGCSRCGARFDTFTGKPKNDKAEGYRLQVYKVTYDKEKSLYTIWK